MRCNLLTLSSYLDGELDARRRGEVEAHLIGCRRCGTGLSNLRLEDAHIGALARVRVTDESVASLLYGLGILQPGEPLPPRHDDPPADPAIAAGTGHPEPPVTPPWLTGRSGAALPWRADIPGRPRRVTPSGGGPSATADDGIESDQIVEVTGRADPCAIPETPASEAVP